MRTPDEVAELWRQRVSSAGDDWPERRIKMARSRYLAGEIDADELERLIGLALRTAPTSRWIPERPVS